MYFWGFARGVSMRIRLKRSSREKRNDWSRVMMTVMAFWVSGTVFHVGLQRKAY